MNMVIKTMQCKFALQTVQHNSRSCCSQEKNCRQSPTTPVVVYNKQIRDTIYIGISDYVFCRFICRFICHFICRIIYRINLSYLKSRHMISGNIIEPFTTFIVPNDYRYLPKFIQTNDKINCHRRPFQHKCHKERKRY